MQHTKKICDLHTHTVHSDGTYTPSELVLAAVKSGLSAIALTDHNNCDGLAEFIAQAEKCGIEGAAGVELSTQYRDKELHLIALFVTPDHYADIEGFVGDLKARKNLANRALIERLNKALGFELNFDRLVALTPDGYINRAHIAADMLKMGYVTSISEAFEQYLSERAGYYVPVAMRDFFDAIGFVRSIGAVSVLAHPLLQLSERELEELLPIAKERGLCAFETQYVAYTSEQRDYSSRLASELGLLESGGSDFHGKNKPGQELGVGRGDLCVPYEFYGKLKEKTKSLI